MTIPSARLHVTKIAAAERQLRSAIRMFFAGEDELAVHTLASAAYRLLADLKAERGIDEVGDVYQTAIFYLIRDFHRATLPEEFTPDSETMEWIRGMAELLPIRA